jgi:transcriptional regulator with XRE-family HTH domain
MAEMAATKERRTPLSDRDNAFAIQRVRELMAARSLSQAALAMKTAPKVTQGRLSDILNSKVRFTERTVALVAAGLGVSPEDLLPPRGDLDAGSPHSTSEQAADLNRMSGTDRSVSGLGASLEGFLERHPEAARKKRVRWYVENTGFKLEPWVELDDRFWVAQFRFWEQYLAEVDAESGEEGPKPPRKSHR